MTPDLTLPASLITRCAIYGWRRKGIYLYIGQSKSVLKRVMHHHVINHKDKINDRIDKIDVWFCCESKLLSTEKRFVDKYKPPLNWVRPTRDGKVKGVYPTFKEAARAKGLASPTKRARRYDPQRFTDEELAILDSLVVPSK